MQQENVFADIFPVTLDFKEFVNLARSVYTNPHKPSPYYPTVDDIDTYLFDHDSHHRSK